MSMQAHTSASRKRSCFIEACALVAAGAAIFWSQDALVASRADTAASLGSHRSLLAAQAATTAAMSPIEMMISYNRPLPVEQWDAF